MHTEVTGYVCDVREKLARQKGKSARYSLSHAKTPNLTKKLSLILS